MIHETVRRMINTLVVDLTEESSRRIAERCAGRYRRGSRGVGTGSIFAGDAT